MNRIEAIIFDCDGVLFESHQANLAYYNRIFNHTGHPLISDPHSPQAHICHTASSPVVFETLLGSEHVEAALDFAATLDYREFIPLMIENVGLRAALSRLGAAYPLAVATNRGGSMRDILEHFALAHSFTAIVTSRDVNRPKPAPDMLHLAAQRLGVDTSSCLFVGDSELDVRAAMAADMAFVAFGGQLEAEAQFLSHADFADWILGD